MLYLEYNGRMKKILKLTVPLLIISFLLFIVIKNWQSVDFDIKKINFSFLFLALVTLVFANIGGAIFWKSLLSFFSFELSFKQALRIFTISNFGRFLPGVAIHYFARIYLSKSSGLSLAKSTSTIILELYYTFCGGLITSLFSLNFLLSRFNLLSNFYYLIILGFVVFLILNPRKIFLYIRKIPFFNKKVPEIQNLSFNNHLKLLLFSSFLFLLNGFAFYLLFLAINNSISFLLISGLFSLTWLIGFLTPLAPGGLGVSDLSLAFLLSSSYSLPLASFLTVMYRVLLICSELLVFLIVMILNNFNLSKHNQIYEKKYKLM